MGKDDMSYRSFLLLKRNIARSRKTLYTIYMSNGNRI